MVIGPFPAFPMSRPIHFEIHALKPESTAAFYTDMFGWKFEKYEGLPMDYWGVITGPEGTPGINGGMMRRMGEAPKDGAAVNAYVCTIDVSDLDAMLKKAEGHNCALAHGKVPIPGLGWLAYIKDPEGNIIGMMQNDPKAGM